VLIHRVEHPLDGRGPYNSEDHGIEGIHTAHGDSIEHPSSVKSLGKFPEPDQFCGFVSKKALTRWFEDFIPQLREAGYKYVQYEVDPKHVLGPDRVGQVLFFRSASTCILRKEVPCPGKPRTKKRPKMPRHLP
jgi:hypothetical protein